MTVLSSQPYKGTRDYYPSDKRIQNYIFNTWKKVVEQYGYEEYGAPLIEPLELYAAKSGQELVNDQTYTFTDRGGRIVAIRPEMTPTISRMVAARRQELAYPARLYSIANFMRYERPQRGREREFWQLNVDVFGVDSLQADIEIISLADTLLKTFGATGNDYTIRVNDRSFINAMMHDYFCLTDEQATQMMSLFDRRRKITEAAFIDQASDILAIQPQTSLDHERLEAIQRVVNATTIDELPTALQTAPSLQPVLAVLDGLRALGVDSVTFDATLMRGLDYYTGIVFEVYDTHPDNNRSLFGGGRYDGLVGLFGAEPISAVGMAPGGTMMEHFLSVHNLLPSQTPSTQLYIATIGDVAMKAQQLAKKLRQSGINTELDITDRKIDKQIKTADKKNRRFILFVGEQDSKNDTYAIKDLTTGEQQTMTPDEIIAHLSLSSTSVIMDEYEYDRKKPQ